MTDTLSPDAVAAAPLDLRDRLDYALATIGDTELATVIATAGLAAVHDEWQRTRADLAVQQDCGRALALRIAHLTDEARRWKRRWAGAVAQAKHEHERAEQLREELADYQLAASEQQGAAARVQVAPCWCGHAPDAHVTDDGDNAICRACWGTPNFHQAHHVHAPEQP